MSTFNLKIIAIISMGIDHVGAILFPEQIAFRIIGRLAFPIFAFLIVEGFFYTKKVYKYGIRLLIFAIISEIPFDLAFEGKFLEFSKQNVFFTLFLGLCMVYLLDKYKNIAHRALTGIGCMVVAYFLNVDYTFVGMIIIFAFYLLRKQKIQSIIAQILINTFTAGGIQIFASLSMIPISIYNGQLGRFKMKYFFYVFYPAHLLIIYSLKFYL